MYLTAKNISLEGGLELAVLKYLHLVLLTLSDSLIAINKVSLLQSSRFSLAKREPAVLPFAKTWVLSAKDKLLFQTIGKIIFIYSN